MKPIIITLFCLLATAFSLTACVSERVSSQVDPSVTATARPTFTNTSTVLPTATPQLTDTPTATPRFIAPTRVPTETHIPTVPYQEPLNQLPAAVPAFISTPISEPLAVIGEDNYQRLQNVAVWGRGRIRRVAFSQEGDRFAIGTAWGIAIYELRSLDQPYQWIDLQDDFWYTHLNFSEDGEYLSVSTAEGRKVWGVNDGHEVAFAEDMHWVGSTDEDGYYELKVLSKDGSLQFSSHFYWQENEYFSEDGLLSRTVTNTSTGESLFTFQDEPIRILYEERSSPEGCDLKYFSPCGNAIAPKANGPFRAAFSNDNELIMVLYRPPAYGGSNSFSVLRIYSTKDGRLLMQIGDYDRPVEDFAIAPDSNQIVVGFVDGSVQLWDINDQRIIYSNRHFNSGAPYLDFSSSSKFVLVGRKFEIEARGIQDGSLIARYSGTAYAVSPVEDRMAIGDEKGNIRIINIPSGDGSLEIAAHADWIYALQFSDDGKTLVSSGRDCKLQAWEVKTGRLLNKFEETWTDAIGEGWTKSRIFVYSFNFVPGMPQVLGFGSWGRVVSWNLYSGARSFLIEPEQLEFYQGMMTLKPHFPESFSVDKQNNVFYIDQYAFDLHTGAEMGDYKRDEDIPIGCYANGPVTKDGNLMFTMGYQQRQDQICILDAGDKHLIGSFRVEAVGWPYLSPDGTRLFVPSASGPIFVYAIPGTP